MECSVWANLAKNSENMVHRPFGCPFSFYINRGGGQPDCHFIFSSSQRSPQSKHFRCRRSLSFLAPVAAVTKVAPVSVRAVVEPSLPCKHPSLHHTRTSPVSSLAEPEPSLPCPRFSSWCPVPSLDQLSSHVWLVQSYF